SGCAAAGRAEKSADKGSNRTTNGSEKTADRAPSCRTCGGSGCGSAGNREPCHDGIIFHRLPEVSLGFAVQIIALFAGHGIGVGKVPGFRSKKFMTLKTVCSHRVGEVPFILI